MMLQKYGVNCWRLLIVVNGSKVRPGRLRGSRAGFKVKLSLGCAGFAVLTACAGGPRTAENSNYYLSHAQHDYNPPGPPSDPWGPYIQEASARFDVPAMWIRQVMRVESGGHEYIGGQLVVSAAGAMGLMQLEPETYQEMASQYGLGNDPFNPYDNIMAGTAYIHAMYQVYGSPGFLAAYNAGPGRLNSYMNYSRPLPDETKNYVAMIAPRIQGYYPAHRSVADQLALNTEPMSQAPGLLPPGFVPNASYGLPANTGDNTGAQVQVASIAPVQTPSVTQAVQSSEIAPVAQNTAVAEVQEAPVPPPPPPPSRPAVPAYQSSLSASALAMSLPPPPPSPARTQPQPRFALVPSAMADTPSRTMQASAMPPSGSRHWAIQVGAYSNASNARAALGMAELSAVSQLVNGQAMVQSIHRDGKTTYRARIVGLPHEDAVNACNRLSGGPTGCVIISPDES
ncbi:lytic transglycosylase domain-containing protein [Acidocella aromatica]|uniref:Murein transglycosylase n=1 Tax=Acidocella aromatica TaxID=1303579 RepID=A0A840VB81_9PROT|nr:lytic transglycosylase domain-containing protein [Acidocella aromatica]MBB5372854.1 hypothetical protein [Acidocella aromatica]